MNTQKHNEVPIIPIIPISSFVCNVSVIDKSEYDAWYNDKMKYSPVLKKFLPNEEADIFNKNLIIENKKIYFDDCFPYVNEDLNHPIACEMIIANGLMKLNKYDGYFSFNRFIQCMNYKLEYFNLVREQAEDGTFIFGYKGRR